jgi:hypothetical protein
MHMNKKTAILLLLAATVWISVAAVRPPENEPKRNLKVLPRDISHEDLDKIMHGFNDALGVKCNFCHAGKEVDGRYKLDFASDEKENKGAARYMLKMTEKINKKYFKEEGASGRITCMTCHNGNAHPK